jgi:hypothetical protein
MTTDNVRFEALDLDNYGTWSFNMKNLLIMKDLWDAIEDDDNTKTAKALSLIGLNVKEQHFPTIVKCTTAKEAWEALETVYKSKSIARRLQLRRQLTSLKKGNAEPLTKYIARARTLMADLVLAGHDVKETDVVLSVLSGLPRDYATVIAVIETSDEEYTLDKLLTKLLLVEQRITNDNGDTKAFYASTGGNGRPNFGNQGNRGYPGKTTYGNNGYRGNSSYKPAGSGNAHSGGHNQGSSGGNNHYGKKCYYCGKLGHLKAECRKKARDEAGQPTSAQAHAPKIVALMASEDTESVHPQHWFVDSGANRHLTPYKSLLSNLREEETPTTITFGNNTTVRAAGVGDVIFWTRQEGQWNRLKLNNVLYVPEAAFNLFSVKRSTSMGATVEFNNDMCIVKKDGKVKLEATAHGNDLYCFEARYNLGAVALAARATSKWETAELWHRRLGHLGYDNLAKLASTGMVQGIGVPVKDILAAKDNLCEPCALSKHHRLPFDSRTSRAEDTLHLLHMDLCGPFHVTSLGGSRYTATFQDDYTGLSIVRTLATKS